VPERGTEAEPMDALRQVFATIQKHLGGLNATHKLLVGAIAVILVLALVVVALLTSKPSMVEVLPGAAAAETQKAQAQLDSAGIRSEPVAGRLMVRAGDVGRARAILAQAGVVPGDKAMYFETLIARNDWMNSRQVNERNFHIALQNELGRTISEFKGVSKASVQISVPEPSGLGAQVRRPSASIAITSDTGQTLPQSIVDAAARFVSGSLAGLSLENVQVIDTIAGKPRVVTTEDASTPASAMEHAQKVERETRQKVHELLAYIPGVIVAVTASVDVTRSVSEIQQYLPDKKGSVQLEKKKVETINTSTQASPGAEPGFAANQTADINRGASVAGNRTDSTEENSEYDNRFGSKTEKIIDPKGQSTSVAVSVNVPRGYVARLMKESAGEKAGDKAGDKAAPDEAAVLARFEKEVKPQIIATLLPHVRAMIAQANPSADPKSLQDSIAVAMIPVDLPEVGTQTAGVLGSLGGGSGGSSVLSLGGGLIDKVVLGVLSLAAMGMMISMVRKAGKKTETPTAEELVGLPPTLDTAGEVIGEAEETEMAMAGIEVGEDEMQAQKVLEQVGQMVEKDPESASKLLGRWVQVEE
jgi:flagellar M-ring protein FliF